MKLHFTLGVLLLVLLSGCSTTTVIPEQNIVSSSQEHQQQLNSLVNWQVKGKLAFITPKERQSANVLWQTTNKKLNQLSLSTFLGINIVDIKQQQKSYIINADGQQHEGDNLSLLIWQLTGLTLPVDALNDWLKGSPHLSSDKLQYAENTYYPQSLTSYFNQQQWQVKYQQYRQVNGVTLPHKIVITQGELSIKLQVNRWET